MSLHFRDPRTSPQLRRILEEFWKGYKLTTLQLQALGSCSASTAVAELRTWMARHHPTHTISPAKFERISKGSNKVFSYRLVQKDPGASFRPARALSETEKRKIPAQVELFSTGVEIE